MVEGDRLPIPIPIPIPIPAPVFLGETSQPGSEPGRPCGPATAAGPPKGPGTACSASCSPSRTTKSCQYATKPAAPRSTGPQPEAGPRRPPRAPGHAIGRSRGGLTTRSHHAVDGQGRPPTAGRRRDVRAGARRPVPVVAPRRPASPQNRSRPPGMTPAMLLGDKAYSSDLAHLKQRSAGTSPRPSFSMPSTAWPDTCRPSTNRPRPCTDALSTQVLHHSDAADHVSQLATHGPTALRQWREHPVLSPVCSVWPDAPTAPNPGGSSRGSSPSARATQRPHGA